MSTEEQTELLREMRDLLRVMAEPALAKRDEGFRGALTKLVGTSRARAKAVSLMDGSKTQATICKEGWGRSRESEPTGESIARRRSYRP